MNFVINSPEVSVFSFDDQSGPERVVNFATCCQLFGFIPNMPNLAGDGYEHVSASNFLFEGEGFVKKPDLYNVLQPATEQDPSVEPSGMSLYKEGAKANNNFNDVTEKLLFDKNKKDMNSVFKLAEEVNSEPLTLKEVENANKKLNEPIGFQAYC